MGGSVLPTTTHHIPPEINGGQCSVRAMWGPTQTGRAKEVVPFVA